MKKWIPILAALLLSAALPVDAQEHTDSTDIFHKHLQLNAIVVTGRAWQSHLSRLKEAGIYNMGRSFSVKLLIPIQ